MTKCKTKIYENLGIKVKSSEFISNNVKEVHHSIETISNFDFPTQLDNIFKAQTSIFEEQDYSEDTIVLKRIFLSDIANQYDDCKSHPIANDKSLTSFIGQPPLSGGKISVLLYCIVDSNENVITRSGDTFEMKRGKLNHKWYTPLLIDNKDTTYNQTTGIFENLINDINSRNSNLLDNVIRTWIYVSNIDLNYADVVESRKEIFKQNNLTPQTHFIASTGIEGRHFSHDCKVFMDAYAIDNIDQEQITFMTAPDNLNPTHEYGVTFERGTAVEYGDRKHMFISGTASINNKGEVVHVGDIKNQTHRTLENIEALLRPQGANLKDMSHFIVYLRDIADKDNVIEILDDKIGEQPYMIVLAPVCRPGWLIEIEGIAITKNCNENIENF